MITAIILAGGIGSRVGAGIPKQFVEVLGKPLLAYTVEIYQKHPKIDSIEIVCHAQWIDYVKEMVSKFQLTKVKWIIEGGNTFQQSTENGVYNLKGKIADDDIVMIHYGASPFTSQETLTDAIRVCKHHGMSASAIPCYQLIGSKDDNGTSKTWIDRDKQVQITCPQSFRYNYLLEIYEKASQQGLLEKIEPHTTSLMYALGLPLYLSFGDQTNIKITTKEDFQLFEAWVMLKANGKQVETKQKG